jgi:hypothetical protein
VAADLDARLELGLKHQVVEVEVEDRILFAICLLHCWEQLKLLRLEAAGLAGLL